jgi:NADH-quinone oxidoreductase subunit N
MLYGMSLLYGLAGSTSFLAIRAAAAEAPAGLVLLAVVLCLAGLGYKVAVVPFHMWCPDVYEGAPTPVTAFLSVAPKAAGFALALRFFDQGVPAQLATSARSPWLLLVLVLAVVTMTAGNLGALGQQSAKRLLAYSSIAHAGSVLLGLATGLPGQRAVLFYLATYLFMTLVAFTVVAAVERATGSDALESWRGLGFRAPVAALAFTVALFALAGLPPTAGFIAKYYVFAALIETGRAGGGPALHVVAVIGVLNSVLALAYYARFLRAMYLQTEGAPATPLALPRTHTLLLVLLAPPLLVFGVYWSPLDELVGRSVDLYDPTGLVTSAFGP